MADHPENAPKLSDDLIWGVENIAREINRTDAQTYHLISIGALKGVHKLSHKIIVASRQALHRQFNNTQQK
jgi:hypothetical protein